MKKAKVVLMGLVVLAMVAAITTPAAAKWMWKYVTVDSVETNSDGVVTLTLTATVPNGRSGWFTVPAGEENRMLSVALTAMVNGMTVKAYVDWPNSGTEIESIILVASP